MDNNKKNPVSYYPRPWGVSEHRAVPQASNAPRETSNVLVTDDMEDAPYFRALEQKGIRLNEPQIEAVRYGEGPLLTLAGAGCGKTTVLAARTGYLISLRRVHPSSILLITFTNKAAAEMKERISKLPGITASQARSVQARTFHSFSLALLRHYGVKDDVFGEQRAQHTVLNILQRQMGMREPFAPETLLSALTSWKISGRQLEDMPASTADEINFKSVLMKYEAWKANNHKMDFDDILLRARQLLNDPEVLVPLQNKFQYVMVDEFQDTNEVQYEIIRLITEKHGNLMVVGDDDQTIYSFNGARHESILNFDKVYPDAAVITLGINYRSDSRILGLGSEIVCHNVERREKRLLSAGDQGSAPQFGRPADAEEEAEWVVSHLTEQVQQGKLTYRDIAILHRTASSSRAVFEQLIMQGIPCIQYGASPVFYDHSLVRPIIDHLRLSIDPRNFGALQSALGPLYVSKEAGMAYILAEEKKQAKKYPLIHLTGWPQLRSFQQDQVKERIKLIKKLKTMKPVYAVQEVRRAFYDKYIEAENQGVPTQYKEGVLETLDELETAARRFDTVQQFVEFADELSTRHKQMESLQKLEQANAVHLMTIHRAKGLEFPCVYLIGASEGILPHSSALAEEAQEDRKASKPSAKDGELLQAALEEERRLAYVAVTRAKSSLFITSPAYHHGKNAAVSRFLLEAFGVKNAPKEAVAASKR
ncbi:ATP-dependent helicase [Paenibacillus sediminis]|uniref:DNA 3'-5' helicase n=1 Tax=Paenibacillus sediminis TaxID=664909 RepID=A0ABS4H920_9BACL|nr:ATP-dependent helicase [Paenibacillus sediminis]MBP1938545.1 DNA helicase-2/ATP-dependent DNA helicase PcrA [Paenibacillus sediminis]